MKYTDRHFPEVDFTLSRILKSMLKWLFTKLMHDLKLLKGIGNTFFSLGENIHRGYLHSVWGNWIV